MSVPQPSRVPSAVRALVALGERMRVDGVVDRVLLGPRPQAQVKGMGKAARLLAVFVTDRAADQSADPLPGQTDQYVDTAEIVCNAVSWSGGGDVGQHMDNCAAIWDALRLHIEADKSLGGVCEVAYMGRRATWSPENGSTGANVILAFTVRVQSYV
jgi:hypothetical protein